ncbi:hypothetical protein [Sebaldella sp. S0638]|uniref:hypothetical protein n=1 Tax=Sebaldella sp. S0638 TaxID=2957809 RepID=UPI0020A1FAE8|nr:hypothetical protein [Sebaldella sp. S0638]MCP1226465.1 hypothetical protein [Sebaldella sp. S0638]
MNITDHALMRWAQRIEEDHISSQVAFKDWKALNPEKVTQYEKDLREAFKKAEYLTEGIYDDRKKEYSKFYIDKEAMLLYVVSTEDNLVTLYYIEFVTNKAGNKNILQEFLTEILEKEKEQEEFESKKAEELKELGRRKETLEMEKKELREKLNLLESEQGLLNKQIETTRNRGQVLGMHIKNMYRKIIKSIEF